MDSEDKRTVWIVGLLLGCLLLLVCAVAYWHISIVRTYTNAGYNRTTLPGADYTYWVKDVND